MNGGPRISAVLQQGVTNKVFPGGVLLVRVQGDVLYHEAVGVKGKPPYDQPVTIHTIYDLASLTKPLATTTAILSLIQAGTITFDQTISFWIGELKRSPFGRATVRQLLHHSAGFPAWRPYYERLAPNAQKPEQETERQSRMQTVLSCVAEEKLEYPPGSRSVYSDVGFIVLGLIVERSAGENLATYCQRNIFDPLLVTTCAYLSQAKDPNALNPSLIAPTEEDLWRGRTVHGEVHDANAYALGGVAGHAGLFGTAESISRITQEWLGGVHGQSTLLSADLIRECVRSERDCGVGNVDYGFGNAIGNRANGTIGTIVKNDISLGVAVSGHQITG